MSKNNKNYVVNIPDDVSVYYSSKRKTLIIKGPLKKKLLKLQVKVRALKKIKALEITPYPLEKLSVNKIKKIKAIQGTTASLFKQYIIESSSIIYSKLNLVGIGYRVFNVENFEQEILAFKLGFSHSIYFKMPGKLKISCIKLTKLFVYGTDYQNLTQVAANIRAKKTPEPYKGKGIRYDDEKVSLKTNKKI
jgi:large subunit ribosomal protein L6